MRVFIQYCTMDRKGWKFLNQLALRCYLNLKLKGGLDNPKIDFIVNGKSPKSEEALRAKLPANVAFYHSQGQCIGNGIIAAGEIAEKEGTHKHLFTTGCTTLLSHNGLTLLLRDLKRCHKATKKPTAIHTWYEWPYPLPLGTPYQFFSFNPGYAISIEKVRRYCITEGFQTDKDGVIKGSHMTGVRQPATKLGHFAATNDFLQTFPPRLKPELALSKPRGAWESELLYGGRAKNSDLIATYDTFNTHQHRAHAITLRAWDLGEKGLLE